VGGYFTCCKDGLSLNKPILNKSQFLQLKGLKILLERDRSVFQVSLELLTYATLHRYFVYLLQLWGVYIKNPMPKGRIALLVIRLCQHCI
jgi:hypothetical protein